MLSDGAIVAIGDVGRDATSCLSLCFSVSDFGLSVAGRLASIYSSAARFSPSTIHLLCASGVSGHCGVSPGPTGAVVAHDVCVGSVQGESSPCPPGGTQPRLRRYWKLFSLLHHLRKLCSPRRGAARVADSLFCGTLLCTYCMLGSSIW